jgi:hypothetical protein
VINKKFCKNQAERFKASVPSFHSGNVVYDTLKMIIGTSHGAKLNKDTGIKFIIPNYYLHYMYNKSWLLHLAYM